MITVDRWVPDGEADAIPESCGWMGGFVQPGMVWADYLSHFNADAHPYLEAMRADIVAKNLRLCGNQHQSNAVDGVPVFSDGTCCRLTFRAWGDLMAAVWNSVDDGAPHSYMSFYMGDIEASTGG